MLMKIDAIDGEMMMSFLLSLLYCVQLHKLKDFSATTDCLLLITQQHFIFSSYFHPLLDRILHQFPSAR
jgi:hypothetical protein